MNVESKVTIIIIVAALSFELTIVFPVYARLIDVVSKANKGELPWPTEKGYVSTGYGDVPHPEYSNIVIHNSGIDITTDSGSSARAVFAGEVSGVQVSQTTNTYTVLVRHGDFFTAYSNLSSVSVSVGNKVAAKQTLGKIKTNAKGNSVLKFVINQNTTILNPKSWLKPR